MKVWGGIATFGGEQRRVFMGGTIKAFLEASGLTRFYISDTGNPAELELGLKHPGVLWVKLDHHGFYFIRASAITYQPWDWAHLKG